MEAVSFRHTEDGLTMDLISERQMSPGDQLRGVLESILGVGITLGHPYNYLWFIL